MIEMVLVNSISCKMVNNPGDKVKYDEKYKSCVQFDPDVDVCNTTGLNKAVFMQNYIFKIYSIY